VEWSGAEWARCVFSFLLVSNHPVSWCLSSFAVDDRCISWNSALEGRLDKRVFLFNQRLHGRHVRGGANSARDVMYDL